MAATVVQCNEAKQCSKQTNKQTNKQTQKETTALPCSWALADEEILSFLQQKQKTQQKPNLKNKCMYKTEAKKQTDKQTNKQVGIRSRSHAKQNKEQTN